MRSIEQLTLMLVYHLLITTSLAFFSHPPRQASSHRNHLFGLPEWRDNAQDDKPIPLLPFAANEALVQGQAKDSVFKDGRYFDLLQDCIDDYESIVGMALMGDDGLLQDMPLCEIHDFEVMAGYRGKVTVSVTLLAVGRAKILELTQMKPVMMGKVTEVFDSESVNVDQANEFVDDIETIITDLSCLEGGISPKNGYDRAYELALQTDTQGYLTTSDPSSVGQHRSVSELTAASWAAFACVSNKSSLHKAIATTSLTRRLELGLKAVLDEKYQASAVSSEGDGDVGFE